MAAFMDNKSVFICREKETQFACITRAEHREGFEVEINYCIFLCFEIGDGWLYLQALVFFRGRTLLCGMRVRND